MPQQRLGVGVEESLAELKDDSGAAELAERVRGLAIRPDQGAVGELLGRAVVVADDDLEAERLGRRDLGGRRDPAVDRQDETAAVTGEPRERLLADAVALVEAVGQMPFDLGPELPQDQDGQCGCADPVRVVVAVDADVPALGDRGANCLTRGGHVPEAERVVRRQRSLEERARAGHVFVPTPDEHGRRRRAERKRASERRDGVALTWFDRPGALVHGQSTLGSAPDGTSAGFSSCGRNRRGRQQTAHFRYEGVACDATVNPGLKGGCGISLRQRCRRAGGYSRGSSTPSTVSTIPTTTTAAAAPRIIRGCLDWRSESAAARYQKTASPATA